ncbi:hypothetical protein V3C99_016713 [Haemonchus contortus]|uniref:PH domain-containing protein n=1 Tax=Haemonchus contortus TaxID=6289 RepID=A0A7I4YXE7_HAECO
MYVCMSVCSRKFTQFCFTEKKNTFRGRDKFGIGGAWDKIDRAHMSSAELRPPGAGHLPEWAVPTVKHLIFASKKFKHRGKMFKGEDWVKNQKEDTHVLWAELSQNRRYFSNVFITRFN